MKKEFQKNSNFSLAGLSCTAALTAKPARNAPTMPGRLKRLCFLRSPAKPLIDIFHI